MPLADGEIHGIDAHVMLNERTVTLIAEAAADRAAKRSVKDVFFILGIDLDDEQHVRATSESMREMRDRWHSKREHKTEARRAFYAVLGTLFVSVTSTLATLFATGHIRFHWWDAG